MSLEQAVAYALEEGPATDDERSEEAER